MRVCIPAEAPSISANIDEHFGRANFFAIYDTQTKTIQFIENPGCHSNSGAGPSAVQQILKHNVKIVIAYRIGPKAMDVLLSNGIQFIETQAKTIEEAIKEIPNE